MGLNDYENWVMESDMLNAYQEYKVQLQILSLNNQKTQLVVKAPEHLWNLNVLLKVFPSARIVMTHRNPLQSIGSYSSMISMLKPLKFASPLKTTVVPPGQQVSFIRTRI